ncbi:MAG TPA: hypothetical protein VKB84_07800 [Candidatus Binataceae bacterium]|nr:hypothetical protein [Candidatus Binataceae bacterium]
MAVDLGPTVLVAFTSLADPALELLAERNDMAVVVPQHLSQPGWRLEDGDPGSTRLVTSRGVLRASQVSGVITRLARVQSGDLEHVNAADRNYAAAEMTAFLAAIVDSLPCPVINRPCAISLLGPSWSQQHWLRAATAAGIATCVGEHPDCGEGTGISMLDGAPLGSGCTAENFVNTARQVGALAPVHLVHAVLCRRDGGLIRVSLRPPLTTSCLDAIARAVAAGRVAM